MKRKTSLFLLLLLVLTIPSVWGIIHPGFFVSDDGNWMVIRFSAFFEALKSGQFPVRFLFRLNNLYGYPVSDFLYPLFMYLAVPIHVLGFNFLNSIKVVLIFSMFFSTVFSYLWLKKHFSNVASLIGSLVFTYFPYHLFDLYKRGSVGEILSFAIIPFIFWQIERKSLLLSSLGLALLICAHNTLAILFLPIILIYLFLEKVNFKKILLFLIISLGLSCFFWLPALYDSSYTVFGKTAVSKYTNYFVTLNNLNLFGFISLITFLLGIIIIFLKRNKEFIYFFLLFLVFGFFSLSLSKPIWDLVSLTSFIQFPFRLLSVVCLAVCYLVSYQIDLFKKNLRIYISIIFLILIILSAKDFVYPKNFEYYPDSFYSTNLDTTTVKNEYMPKWVKSVPLSIPKEKIEVLEGKAEISNLENKGNISFDINASKKSVVLINTVYFPGWAVKVDDSKTLIDYEKSGLIQFSVDKGVHRVLVYFTETPLRLVSDLVSLVSLFFIVFASFLKSLRFLLI